MGSLLQQSYVSQVLLRVCHCYAGPERTDWRVWERQGMVGSGMARRAAEPAGLYR